MATVVCDTSRGVFGFIRRSVPVWLLGTEYDLPFAPSAARVRDLEVQRSDLIGDPMRDVGEHGRQEELERSIVL